MSILVYSYRKILRSIEMQQIMIVLLALMTSGCSSGEGYRIKNGNSALHRAENENRDVDRESKPDAKPAETNDLQGSVEKAPQTVRDYFIFLPDKILNIERFRKKKEQGCGGAKREILANNVIFENPQQTYLEMKQSATRANLVMAIFKSSSGRGLIAVYVTDKQKSRSSFFEFRDGVLEDVSLERIPEYTTANVYEPASDGKSVGVYAKKIIAQNGDVEVSRKGEKLYSLSWSNGEFIIAR